MTASNAACPSWSSACAAAADGTGDPDHETPQERTDGLRRARRRFRITFAGHALATVGSGLLVALGYGWVAGAMTGLFAANVLSSTSIVADSYLDLRARRRDEAALPAATLRALPPGRTPR